MRQESRRGKFLLMHLVMKSAALASALDLGVEVKLQVLDCCHVLL